jgi:hypothetical protein
MNALDLINKRLAAPKAFQVVTTYECGKVRIHETETEAQAYNWADLESRKLGAPKIDGNGNYSRVSRVSVETL